MDYSIEVYKKVPFKRLQFLSKQYDKYCYDTTVDKRKMRKDEFILWWNEWLEAIERLQSSKADLSKVIFVPKRMYSQKISRLL